MSYRIRYGRDRKKMPLWDRLQLPLATLVLFLAITNGIYAIKDNLPALRYRLMPWTRLDVQEAYAAFCDDLTEGKPLAACLEAFCEVILQPISQDAEEPD